MKKVGLSAGNIKIIIIICHAVIPVFTTAPDVCWTQDSSSKLLGRCFLYLLLHLLQLMKQNSVLLFFWVLLEIRIFKKNEIRPFEAVTDCSGRCITIDSVKTGVQKDRNQQLFICTLHLRSALHLHCCVNIRKHMLCLCCCQVMESLRQLACLFGII